MKLPHVAVFLLPFFFMGGIPLTAQSETLVYELYANKGKIGTWEVSRRQENGQTTLASKRTVIFKLVKKIKTETFFKAVYEEGQLLQADISVTVNDEPRRVTTIRRSGDNMVFTVEGKPSRTLDHVAQLSNLTIFFDPPAGAGEVFYLQKGIFLPVKALGGAAYQVDLAKEEKNLYYYQGGRMVRAILEDGLLRTTVKLVKAKQTNQGLLADN